MLAPVRRRIAPLLALFTVLATLCLSPLTLAWAGPNDGLPKTTEPLERSTPRRAMSGFLQSAHEGNYTVAANYLDLRAIPKSRQASDGPELARKLIYVLDRKLDIELDKIPDDPEAKEASAGSISMGDEPVNLALTRTKFPDGNMRWVLARSTVQMIGPLYEAYGPSEWATSFPPALTKISFLGNALWQWIGLAILLVGGYFVARALAAGFVAVGMRFARRTKTASDNALLETARRPLRGVLYVVLVQQLVSELHLTASLEDVVHHVTYTLAVVAVAWFVLRAISIAADWIEEKMPTESQLDLRHRSVQTQLELLRRVAGVVITLIALAIGLMQFEFVRNVGVSLLASAGLAGIVLGVAAQKSLSGVIAGIQLSVSQPIRIGDTVVVEKEYGTIEEINLTYVVTRLWDERRLVIPMSRFLEQPFENWSRNSTEILGTVFLNIDFDTPLDQLRMELNRLCEGDGNWDKRVCKLQITDATDARMVARCLVSASSASRCFDLRCAVREGLIKYLRQLEDGRFLGNPAVAIHVKRPPTNSKKEQTELPLPLA